MMKRLAIGIAAVVGAITAPLVGQQVEPPVTQADLERTGAPGIAYLVVEGDSREGHTYGVTREGGNPITLDTSFIIGSVSKSFTALGIMRLAEAGKVDLDEPVATYLDELANAPVGGASLRQLLSHTSGLSMQQGNATQDDFRLDENALKDRVALIAQMDLATPTGTNWDYSNANYQIAGRVIEVVSGQSFSDFMEAEVLAPIGMSDSHMHDGVVGENEATGHSPWFFGKRALTKNQTGAGSLPQGGVVSTANDLAKYAAIMMNGQDDVISAANKELLVTPANEASPYYGLGWSVAAGGGGLVYHQGSNPGYEAALTLIPPQNKAIIVLINAADGFGFGKSGLLRDKVTFSYLGMEANIPSESWMSKAVFIVLMVLPIFFAALTIRLLIQRSAAQKTLRGKSKIRLFVPVVLALGFAWALIIAVPASFGVNFAGAQAFQPDMGLLLALCAAAPLVWALVRLALVYWPGGGARSAA